MNLDKPSTLFLARLVVFAAAAGIFMYLMFVFGCSVTTGLHEEPPRNNMLAPADFPDAPNPEAYDNQLRVEAHGCTPPPEVSFDKRSEVKIDKCTGDDQDRSACCAYRWLAPDRSACTIWSCRLSCISEWYVFKAYCIPPLDQETEAFDLSGPSY